MRPPLGPQLTADRSRGELGELVQLLEEYAENQRACLALLGRMGPFVEGGGPPAARAAAEGVGSPAQLQLPRTRRDYDYFSELDEALARLARRRGAPR